MRSSTPSRGLSQVDAFFVAYQERMGILMQIGAEIELLGTLQLGDVTQMVERLVAQWPQLGQRIRRRLFGLEWSGDPAVGRMVSQCADRREIVAWRDTPIDPFTEPPFQVLFVPGRSHTGLAFRTHHAVADGESFSHLSVEALLALAAIRGGDDVGPLPDALGQHRVGWRSIGNVLRLVRWPRRDVRIAGSARLRIHAASVGGIGVVERAVTGEDLDGVRQRATRSRTALPWICAAAWIRAIHHWNRAHGESRETEISLEVPVSLRRQRQRGYAVGNYLSPLVLLGDASKPLELIAHSLSRQLRSAVRHGAHLRVPLLTAPARYLPWGLFRRWAINTATTGLATSHFTWFTQPRNLVEEVRERSHGALELLRQQIYTPVCLQMGAALSVVAWPDRLQLLVSHRKTALTSDEAETLGDMLAAELVGSIVRQPVAV